MDAAQLMPIMPECAGIEGHFGRGTSPLALSGPHPFSLTSAQEMIHHNNSQFLSPPSTSLSSSSEARLILSPC